MTNYLHVVSGNLNGSFPWSNRIYSSSGLAEGAAQTAWNNAITAFWSSAAFKALMPTTLNITASYTSTMNASWKQTTKTTNTLALAGTAATAAMPYETCAILTLRTSQATKFGHGRWYIPTPAATAMAAAGYIWSAAFTAALAGAWNALTASNAGSLSFQLLHRTGTKTGPGALTIDQLHNADASDEIAVQRRRGDKRVPIRTAVTPF